MKGYYIEPNRFELRRFFSKVHHVGPRGCWMWRSEAARNGAGRPMVGTRDGSDVAARVAHRWFIGPIPHGFEVDHICYSAMCVNPAHLEAVTSRENKRRALARHTHCRNGHLISAANRYRNGRGGTACRMCVLESRRSRQLFAKAAAL